MRQTMLLGDLSGAAAKFEAVFNQSGIFAGIMDLQGYVREVNRLAMDECGYTREQVLDRLFWDTPWWRGSEEMKARIRFATGQAAAGVVFREERRYWVADGSARIVDFAMHPIRDHWIDQVDRACTTIVCPAPRCDQAATGVRPDARRQPFVNRAVIGSGFQPTSTLAELPSRERRRPRRTPPHHGGPGPALQPTRHP
jgi:PAS domain S-box-containing protein